MNETSEKLTIQFIGGPLTLDLPGRMVTKIKNLYGPFVCNPAAGLDLTLDVRPIVNYNITWGMDISYPRIDGRRVIQEPRFEVIPTERGARVKYCLGMDQGIDCVLRVWAAMLLLPPEGFLFHAAGVITPRGRGYLLCGHSGSGKSTLSGGLIGRKGWSVLSDEMPAVLRGKEGWTLGFTPFWGELEPRMPQKPQVPLMGICALEKGRAVELTPLSVREATVLLTESVVSYATPAWFADLLLPFASELASRVPAYRLTVPLGLDPDELCKLMDFN